MAWEPFQQAERYAKRRSQRKLWHKLLGGLACVVVFCTVYALILPAITMEQTAYCGKLAHTHDDSCYTLQLTCGQSAAQRALTDADMAQTQPMQVEPEATQQPDESAVSDETQDVADQTDTTATDEGASAHVHTQACYTSVLTCQKSVHQHTLACYSNPDADVESEAVWTRIAEEVTLTGDWATDVIAMAEQQRGYCESTRNYEVDADGETTRGYTRYGDWYGIPYGDWCAMFVSYCLHYAQVPETAVPYEASCPQWVKQLRKCGLYHDAGTAQPEKGAILFFDYNADGVADHVGLVVSADGGTIRTIEGNSADRVRDCSYAADESQILGYANLPTQEEVTDSARVRRMKTASLRSSRGKVRYSAIYRRVRESIISGNCLIHRFLRNMAAFQWTAPARRKTMILSLGRTASAA